MSVHRDNPCWRLSLPLCVTIFLVLVAVLAPAAQAAKGVDSTIGTKSGSPALGGTFNQPLGVAVNQATGQVYVADSENHRIQRFGVDDNGTPGDPSDDEHVFERAWGWDVVQPGGLGDTVDGSFEICTVASQCQAGTPGGGAGQFGETSQFIALGVDQASGEVYATDVRNRRVSKFTADGGFLRAWGHEVVASGPGNTGGPEICVPANGDTCQAGDGGSLAGEFGAQLFGIEVDSVGNVYVAEGSNARIQKFTPAGAPLRLWGHDVVAGGPGDVAGDNERQQVVVTASGGTFTLSFDGETTDPIERNATAETVEDTLALLATIRHENQLEVTGGAGGPWIVEFTNSLEHAGQPEMTIDGSGLSGAGASASVGTLVNGAEFEICVPAGGDACKAGVGFNNRYAGSSRLGRFSREFYLALDGTDRVYASDPQSGRILRFQADGTAPEAFAVVAPDPTYDPFVGGTDGTLTDYRELTIDRSNDHVFAVKGTGEGNELQVVELAATGELLDTHAVGAGITREALRSIALHESSGRLYLASNQEDHWVIVLDDDGGFQAGSVTVKPATGVTTSSATLNALVNPNGFSTTYQFEYSLDGEAWTQVGTPQSAGDGTVDVPVSAAIAGLQANAEYRFRVAVATTFAGGSTSDEETFTTGATLPTAETVYPRSRTATEATLAGRVNPNNSPTDYYFEWGETESYGNKVLGSETVSGGTTKVVTESIAGLQPDTVYHYRVVAESGEGEAEGDDVEFLTRSVVPAVARNFEMVSPPFKTTRATVLHGGGQGLNANPGYASVDGESVRWNLSYFPLTEESRTGLTGDQMISRRSADGWVTNSLYTLPLVPEETYTAVNGMQTAGSGDFEAQAWRIDAPFLHNEGDAPLLNYTRRDGTGTEGWTGWLRNVDTEQVGQNPASDRALFNDGGTAMARWGYYRGLAEDPDLPGDEDPSDDLQLAGLEGGRTAYLQPDPPSGEKELVAECTDGTTVAERADNGTPASPGDDFLALRACAAGQLTSNRGAALSADEEKASSQLVGPAATALADDGRRLFFASPDPDAPGVPKESCAAGLASATECPPQLFVRQYDAAGEPTVRWISKPAPGMPQQAIGLLGPTIFQGASRDGRYVYFTTTTPLTPDDPNGGAGAGPIVSGTASVSSWDLYRYELPESHEADPGDGTLSRISAGPSGVADPNANPGNNAAGAAARYISDDGQRAFFVAGAPISGADATPPKGGATTPGAGSRNLYLYDANESGADRWRFISRLDMPCSASGPVPGYTSRYEAFAEARHRKLDTNPRISCVRGTPSGSAIAFLSQAQLTGDDGDEAIDVYLYDVAGDELVRVSAPPPGATSYSCDEGPGGTPLRFCNGEFGHQPTSAGDIQLLRGWGGARNFNLAEDGDGVVSAFFESRAQLSAEDDNTDISDVYEWRQGELTLLSSGDPGQYSYYSGNGVDGRDVFIWTSARIDPREIDDSDYDIYDARIGGGFPYTPPPRPCDALAFECEGKATPPPPASNPSSSAFVGPGNVGPKKTRKCGKGKLRRKDRCVKRKSRRAQEKRASKDRGGRR